MTKKISLIGAGQIGGTLAHLIGTKELVNEVVLFDVASGIAKGKALDIAQSTPVSGSNVNLIGTNDYKDTKNSDVVINLCGILFENRKQKFNSIHGDIPESIAKLCAQSKVKKFILFY